MSLVGLGQRRRDDGRAVAVGKGTGGGDHGHEVGEAVEERGREIEIETEIETEIDTENETENETEKETGNESLEDEAGTNLDTPLLQFHPPTLTDANHEGTHPPTPFPKS